MESLVKFLEDKITDKMSVEEIVDVFEQMCSTPLEEDLLNIFFHLPASKSKYEEV